jgi:antitoxin HicB
MRIYRYAVIFEPADEGGYVVTCPALPGLVTEGGTLDGARAMAQDAIRGYWESLAEDGERHRLRMSTQQSKRLSQCPSCKEHAETPTSDQTRRGTRSETSGIRCRTGARKPLYPAASRTQRHPPHGASPYARSQAQDACHYHQTAKLMVDAFRELL